MSRHRRPSSACPVCGRTVSYSWLTPDGGPIVWRAHNAPGTRVACVDPATGQTARRPVTWRHR